MRESSKIAWSPNHVSLFDICRVECLVHSLSLSLVLLLSLSLSGCAHKGGTKSELQLRAAGLAPLKAEGPIEIKLRADDKRPEKVAYFNRSTSMSYEDNQLRHEKEDTVEFVSRSETLKVEPAQNRFTQVITVIDKKGNGDLHDFAMPELGEKLEITLDSRGRILRAGGYPENSIFYVPPISLPEGAVNVGDTWTMQASWLSLEEMVPYQLDMVSIFKNVWGCGQHRCAEIEISGEVMLQPGPITRTMAFKSVWRGTMFFDLDAGTVLWSRTDSDEQFAAGNVSRKVQSCLEAKLTEPTELVLATLPAPSCRAENADRPDQGAK